jgi:hypothetical protein
MAAADPKTAPAVAEDPKQAALQAALAQVRPKFPPETGFNDKDLTRFLVARYAATTGLGFRCREIIVWLHACHRMNRKTGVYNVPATLKMLEGTLAWRKENIPLKITPYRSQSAFFFLFCYV